MITKNEMLTAVYNHKEAFAAMMESIELSLKKPFPKQMSLEDAYAMTLRTHVPEDDED